MLVIFIMLFIIVFAVYVIIDNRRIKVRKQSISLAGSNKNIKILQISDMHSKVLRNSDYNKINKLDIDVVVITGDTFVDKDKEYTCIKDFIKKIKNVKHVLYVDGNNGTKAYDRSLNTLTSFGNYLETLGITVIKDYVEINDIVFTNYNVITGKLLDNDMHGNYKIYGSLNETMKNCKKTNIGLTHYPLNDIAIKKVNSTDEFYVPNLILAGHYHGGQIRIPFYGAILIPNYLSRGFKFFPNQKLVSGFYENGKVKQYISRGVGATTHVKLLSFRLFNTPEIDYITISY